MNYIQSTTSPTSSLSARLRWQISPATRSTCLQPDWERRWDPVSRFAPLEERGVIKITLSVRP